MAQQDPGPQTVRIVAAKAKLKYGDRLTIKNAGKALRWVEWPKDSVPQGAFTRAEDLFGEGKQETRTVLRGIEPGRAGSEGKGVRIWRECPRRGTGCPG